MTIARFKPRSISATVEKITRPIFGKRGFGQGSMIANWGNIVGNVLAGHTFPEQISYPRNQRNNGTLHLRIDSPALALELQHIETQLLDRVNTHFGYRAVAHIRIIQGVLPENNIHTLPEKRKITLKEQNELNEDLNIINDPDLKNALQALGTEVITTN
jgi:hypothetical protein